MTLRPGPLEVTWPVRPNEEGARMQWHGAWIVGDAGEEGSTVYFGRGGPTESYAVPATARALRVRCWPDEDLPAEYVDVFLEGTHAVDIGQLSFDTRQPFSRLEGYQEQFAPHTPYVREVLGVVERLALVN